MMFFTLLLLDLCKEFLLLRSEFVFDIFQIAPIQVTVQLIYQTTLVTTITIKAYMNVGGLMITIFLLMRCAVPAKVSL